MNKLVLLKEVKKENKEININLNNDTNENLNNKYFDFEEKIFNSELNSKIEENELSNLIEKIFFINKNLFIKFLNSIYNDYLDINSNVEFFKDNKNLNKCLLNKANSIIKAKVEDDYRRYEYTIEIMSKDYNNISILIVKDDLGSTQDNVVNFIKKKYEYESIVNEREETTNADVCLLMLNSNIDIPDKYKIKNSYKNNSNLKIIKSWKYDLKEVFKEELYLLLPVKILDLKNMIDSLKNINHSDKVIEKEVERYYFKLDRYIQKLSDSALIDSDDINKIKAISNTLLSIVY